jgi:hypothetical protein
MTGEGAGSPTLRLARWTVASGSNARSRGAVVIASGDHQWEASAEGNGAIDALFRAVDTALAGVLTGHPRLMGFDIRALGEASDAVGVATVTIAPPEGAEGARAEGRYTAEARNENIIAASVDAYLQALNQLLGEAAWAGATESAGNRRRADDQRHTAGVHGVEIDEDEAHHDTTAWFNR